MLVFNCINHVRSVIHPPFEGQMIRAAYLFGDVAKVSGTSYLMLDFERFFAEGNARFKKQMVLSYCSRVADPAYLVEVERMYETIKNSKTKVKHATKGMIVGLKKCEKHLEMLYKNSQEEMRTVYLNCGYLGLMPLAGEDAIVLWGSVAENPESDKDNGVPYSEILRCKWDDEDEVYCFTDLFWEFAAEKNLIVSAAEEDSDDSASVITFPMPEMVPLHLYTSTELKVIKQGVFGNVAALREAIAEWSMALKKENYDTARHEAYYDFYHSRIKPFCGDLSEKISESELLGKLKRFLKGEIGFENYLAVAPAKVAWAFMEWSGMVPKESVYAFEQNLPEGCDGEKSVLLFLSRSYNHQTEDEAGDKKSLEL